MKNLIIAILFLFIPSIAFAADPHLAFQDLVDGPRSGNTDPYGGGAIVTVWGQNLGTPQGSSHVYIGDSGGTYKEANHVYYWINADGGTSGGGPSDLYTYQKMQEIAFSLPTDAPTGAQKIWVVVGGVASNTLDFYVRTSGDIYFVDNSSGVNGAAGDWDNPWQTMAYVLASSAADAGDITYVKGTFTETGSIATYYGHSGDSLTNHFALVGYPGSAATGYNSSGSVFANNNRTQSYVIFSKLLANAYGVGFQGSAYGGFVGNDCRSPSGVNLAGQSGCLQADGQFNMDTSSGLRVFGNEVHDYGGPAPTSNQPHATYFTIRYPHVVGAPEVGWNYIHDCTVRSGIHFFDEDNMGGQGNYSDTLKVHDNVVENQVAPCFDLNWGGISESGLTLTNDTWFYNNLCIDTGIDPVGGVAQVALIFAGPKNQSNVKVWNNTIWGYGDSTDGNLLELYGPGHSYFTFGGTMDWRNNISVDTENWDWQLGDKDPDNNSDNIWWNGGDSTPSSPPSWWDSGTSSSADPNLDASYIPQVGSFAIDNGYDTSSIVEYDIVGNPRMINGTQDIGAFEYQSGCADYNGDSSTCASEGCVYCTVTDECNPSECCEDDPDYCSSQGTCESASHTWYNGDCYWSGPSRSAGFPSGNQAYTTSINIGLTTDVVSTCRYGTSADVDYDDIPNTFGSTHSTTHTQNVETTAGSHTFYTKCSNDSNYHQNPDDYPIEFTVLADQSGQPSITLTGSSSITLGAGVGSITLGTP